MKKFNMLCAIMLSFILCVEIMYNSDGIRAIAKELSGNEGVQAQIEEEVETKSETETETRMELEVEAQDNTEEQTEDGEAKVNTEHLAKPNREHTNNLEKIAEAKDLEVRKEKVATLFIGDSRTVGMDTACNIVNCDDTYVLAKVGEGYSYLSSNLDQKLSSIFHNGYTKVILITNFGVNDVHNSSKYIDYYNEVLLKYGSRVELNIVSVNPVEYCENVSNDSIEKFNSEMQDFAEKMDNVRFINTYDGLKGKTNITVDGLHYTKSCYKTIYKEISAEINS